MKKFRPISLAKCSLKIITKAMTNRITPVGHRFISQNQTAFIKERFILESVVSAHEILHEVHQSKTPILVLKLDYEKAYDIINWEFLDEMLASRGFDLVWRTWVKNILVNGSFNVKINNTMGPYVIAAKGLIEGDPLSPILFNLVADVFTKMLDKAAGANLIQGLLPNVIRGGVISIYQPSIC